MRNPTKKQFLLILVVILILVTAFFMVVLLFREPISRELAPYFETEAPQTEQTEKQTEKQTEHVTEAPQTEKETEPAPETERPRTAEEMTYTFMQGPVAWESKTDWSGEWCEWEMEGGIFSVFGCGLCDLANIYGTFSPYECSPVDMYQFAMSATDYSPDWGYGAIDWPFMKQVLQKTGFTARLRRKDRTYESFQRQIAAAKTAIVLVSSSSDDTYWQDTPGHYVNVFLYDPEKDDVFLGDSGNPSHNRSRVPLRYLYDAMAADSSYQYMVVTDYNEEKNTWKYSGIHEKWTVPAYYRPKEASGQQQGTGSG